MGEINVVPYIDVMLVLLIIFMVTAPLLNKGVEVELPGADAAPIEGSVGRTDFAPGDQVGPTSGALVRVQQVDPIEASFFVPEN
ncbi:MAG: biopolymer transporter ExbD, partial [Pseudomonadota bacterium]